MDQPDEYVKIVHMEMLVKMPCKFFPLAELDVWNS